MIPLHEATFDGQVLMRARLLADRSWVPGDHVTSDYAIVSLLLAKGDRTETLGTWDSRTNAIGIHEGFPLTGRTDLERELPKDSVLTAKAERHGHEAPDLRGVSVQLDFLYRGT